MCDAMFEAEIEDSKIVVKEEGEEVFELGAYGKFEGENLVLRSYEAMNLMKREKIKVVEGDEELSQEDFYKRACELEENFHEKFLVYENLRNRGFVVRPGFEFPTDLRVYERGVSFSEDEKKLKHVKWLMDVVKTNSSFSLSSESEKLESARNIRADLAMGIVDEEGDVTYYELDEEGKLNGSGKVELEDVETAEGFLEEDAVIVWDKIENIYEPRYFGKRRNNRLELNLLEALYLLDKEALEVTRGDGPVNRDELVEIARGVDSEFDDKYEIYRDLRNKGFLVRSGFKFGTHFRVYDRGVELKKGQKSPDEHTKWVVHAVPGEFSWSYPELSRFVRLALNIRSKPTLGVVDGNKKYYRIRRIKP